MVAAAFSFAVMGVLAKLAAQTLSNPLVVFFRSAFGLLLLLPWALQHARELRTRNLGGHVLRGLFGMTAMYCFFFCIAHMALAEALLLNYSLPLFLPLVERIWLGLRLRRAVLWPILLGFAGLLLILRPGTGVFQPIALVGVLAAVFAATAQVGIRQLTRTETVTSIVFYFAVISSVISLGPAIWSWQTPALPLWPVLLGVGACATLGQLLMTNAYHHAPAAEVGPFIYMSVVFAGCLDWWVFAHLPDGLAAAGGLLVIVAGAVALRRAPPPAAASPGD
jgi:drug/metabolite transporter (DMT)-like permease